jgi:uncharacterized protein (TIGR00369 family)
MSVEDIEGEGEIYPGFSSPKGFDVIPIADLGRLGGLAVLQGMIAGDYPAPPIAKTLSYWIAEAEEGRVLFKGMPNRRHLNPLGSIHGGWTATIMDSALACAVMTMLKPGEGYTTAEFKVNLTRPVLPDMGEVFCEGKVLHRGRTLATAEAVLHDERGRLLAHGTETCAIFPIENLMR